MRNQRYESRGAWFVAIAGVTSALAVTACQETIDGASQAGTTDGTGGTRGEVDAGGTAGKGGASTTATGSSVASGGRGGSAGSSGAGGASAGGAGGATGGAAGTTAGAAGSVMGGGGTPIGGDRTTSGSGGAQGGSGGAAGSGGAQAGSGGAAGGAGTSGNGTTTGAWRPFNSSSPWNTRVSDAPSIDPNSTALVADLAASSPANPSLYINIQQYSIPVYWADASTPRQRVSVSLLAAEGFGTGATGSAQVPIPAGAAPAAGTDQHLCIIDKQTNTEWGMWDASNSGGAWTAAVAATADLSGTGSRPPKVNNPTWWTSHGARACGFPLSAGLITVEEMQKGKIEHALVIAYPHVRSHWYTPPASTAQVTTGQALPSRGILCGGHIQLDPTLDVNTLQLSTSGKIIAKALQEYGAYVGDFAGAIAVYADSSPTALAAWNGGLLRSSELSSIDLRKFRVLTIGTQYQDDN